MSLPVRSPPRGGTRGQGWTSNRPAVVLRPTSWIGRDPLRIALSPVRNLLGRRRSFPGHLGSMLRPNCPLFLGRVLRYLRTVPSPVHVLLATLPRPPECPARRPRGCFRVLPHHSVLAPFRQSLLPYPALPAGPRASSAPPAPYPVPLAFRRPRPVSPLATSCPRRSSLQPTRTATRRPQAAAPIRFLLAQRSRRAPLSCCCARARVVRD